MAKGTVVKRRNLKWSDYLGTSEQTLWSHNTAPEREAGGQRGEMLLFCWFWRWRQWAWAKEWRQPLEVRKNLRKHVLTRISRSTTCAHPFLKTIDLHSPRTINLCCFKPRSMWPFATATIGNYCIFLVFSVCAGMCLIMRYLLCGNSYKVKGILVERDNVLNE